MTRSELSNLRAQLTDRDIQLLTYVSTYRLLTSRHLQRLAFDHSHPTPVAAARACNRALTRLRELGVLKTLERRIGGIRAGSAGFVWYLGPAGERLLRDLDPHARSGRRNYREPSRHFVEHTLAVAELAVQTRELERGGTFEVLSIQTEPKNWLQSLSPHGAAAWLKPDLSLTTATAEEEAHYFVEVDLASEHLPVVLRQCLAYQTFRASGRYQAEHGLFPIVLWVTPSEARASTIRAAIAGAGSTARSGQLALNVDLFQVCTADEYAVVISGQEQASNKPGGQEGTTT